MSGICGAFMLDGSDPDLDPVLAVLERRGPDGTNRWSSLQAALGHTSLATTPEALVEVLPLTNGESDCTITADVRLDNRDQLFEALDVTKETRTIGDGELILRAYLKWGEECPKHLLGDFAFAIWDAAKQSLFCARDHLGMRQLIYHYVPGRLFVFATEVEAVLARKGVPKVINRARVADYFDEMEGVDLISTFFEQLFRLPPAHHITVNPDGLSLRQYWRPNLQTKLEPASDQSYADRFLEIFTEAVRCRLRSRGQIGCMLSGGLDSSAISAVAAQIRADSQDPPPMTFSAIGPEVENSIETQSAKAAISSLQVDATTINYADLGETGTELAEMLCASSDPFDSDMSLPRAVYLAGHRRGVKVMLDGVAADIVLGPGNHVAELFRKGHFIRGVQEATGLVNFWGRDFQTVRGAIAGSLWAAFVPNSLRLYRQQRSWRHRDRQGSDVGSGVWTRSFLDRSALAERRAMFRNRLGNGRPFGPGHRLRTLTDPHLVAARERYDRVASALAIEPRDPFLDLRVIEYCLSLPGEQLQRRGWTKLILRHAMEKLLPAEIVNRRGKDHLGWKFTEAVRGYLMPTADSLWGRAELTPVTESRIKALANSEIPPPEALKALDKRSKFKLFAFCAWLNRVKVADTPLRN